MIARLNGFLIEKTPPQVVIDCAGVGYEVEVPMSTFYNLPEVGAKVQLLTYMVVREDAQLLYGFGSEQEKSTFKQLLKVNGIGAKSALSILSGVSIEDLINAVNLQEVAMLTRIPGIGKKTAERIVLELRDKVGKHPLESNISPLKNNSLQQDALNALTALGINRVAAEQALKKVIVPASDTPVEEIIKAALRIL